MASFLIKSTTKSNFYRPANHDEESLIPEKALAVQLWRMCAIGAVKKFTLSNCSNQVCNGLLKLC